MPAAQSILLHPAFFAALTALQSVVKLDQLKLGFPGSVIDVGVLYVYGERLTILKVLNVGVQVASDRGLSIHKIFNLEINF